MTILVKKMGARSTVPGGPGGATDASGAAAEGIRPSLGRPRGVAGDATQTRHEAKSTNNTDCYREPADLISVDQDSGAATPNEAVPIERQGCIAASDLGAPQLP